MEMKYLSIELTEEEKQDAVYWLTAINNTMKLITSPLPMVINKEQAQAYYDGICQAFADAKVLEHLWRVNIAQKYDVDYAIGYDGGKLFYYEG